MQFTCSRTSPENHDDWQHLGPWIRRAHLISPDYRIRHGWCYSGTPDRLLGIYTNQLLWYFFEGSYPFLRIAPIENALNLDNKLNTRMKGPSHAEGLKSHLPS